MRNCINLGIFTPEIQTTACSTVTIMTEGQSVFRFKFVYSRDEELAEKSYTLNIDNGERTKKFFPRVGNFFSYAVKINEVIFLPNFTLHLVDIEKQEDGSYNFKFSQNNITIEQIGILNTKNEVIINLIKRSTND